MTNYFRLPQRPLYDDPVFFEVFSIYFTSSILRTISVCIFKQFVLERTPSKEQLVTLPTGNTA